MAYCNKGLANEGQGTDCSHYEPTPLPIHKALLHAALRDYQVGMNPTIDYPGE